MVKLFVDDLRSPPDRSWEVARTKAAVEWYLDNVGTPRFWSFDHDLGEGQESGFDIAKLLVERILDKSVDPGAIRSIHVHSANPVGAENIACLLRNLYDHLLSAGEVCTVPSITLANQKGRKSW